MKKGIVAIVIAVLAAAVLTVCAIWFFGGTPLNKVVSFKGYEISVPKDWNANAEGVLTNKNETVVGKYLLIYEMPDLSNSASYSGVNVLSGINSETLEHGMEKNILETDQGTAIQYFITDLPNPAPYAASITLYKQYVNEKTCDRIAESFTMPELGTNPPAKDVSAPMYTEIGTEKVYKVTGKDESVTAKNISLIDSFIARQAKKESTGVDILEYKESEENVILSSWVHIESDGGKGYLYSYYNRGDGMFTYDNNPLIFDGITKRVETESGVTSYCLKTGETETTVLLEIPVDRYRDNAETLISLKTSESSLESVSKILQQIQSNEQFANIKVEKDGNKIILTYAEGQPTNIKAFSKDAAVIFSLSSDILTVVAKNPDGTTFELTREKALKGVSTPIDKATESSDAFAKFTEELDDLVPSVEENTGGDVADGTVVYSKTVVISAGMMVTHPRTGKRVAIGPYAEKKGYGHLLGKPITCTIKKSGRGYLATATCGGSVIASYPLESESAMKNFIGTINAYT